MRGSVVAASLALLAGSAVSLAQPVLDGQKDALYGAAKWVQTVPTSWGDNRADLCQSVGSKVAFALNNLNVAGIGGGDPPLVFDNANAQYAAAQAVDKGAEFRIPLSQLGNPAGAIRLAGYVGNGGGNYVSNQLIGGFNLAAGTPRGNLGGDGSGGFNGSLSGVDLSSESIAPGNQFITLPASSGAVTAPTIDGTLEAAFYGAPLWVQNVQTGFGDGTDTFGGNWNNGSEIDAVYARIGTADVGDGPLAYLFLFVAGNIQTGDNFGGNRIQLFFDNGDPAGLNQLTTSPPISGLDNSAGLKFDAGFKATHSLSINAGYSGAAGDYRVQAVFAALTGTPSGGAIGVATANSETVGVGSACPPNEVIALGSEIDAVYSYVDNSSRTLWLMVTGNLKENEFLQLFFDVNGNPIGDAGQNRLHGAASFSPGGDTRNVAIGIADGGFGAINRMGDDGTGALQFDAGFAADYYLNTHIEAGTRQVIDAAVLRTVGRFEIPGAPAVALDYGSYQGKDIPNEINFDGTNFDNLGLNQILYPGGLGIQTGSAPDIFAAFAPREAARVLKGFRDNHAGAFPATVEEWTDWVGFTMGSNPAAPVALRPRAGLIRSRLNNSNVLGVRDTAGPDGSTATTGVEFALKLEELGWDPHSRVRVTGFLIRNGFATIGNQVLGDPAGATDLGEPRAVNFSALPGNQYVVAASCLADYNGINNVDLLDIFAFLNDWFAGVSKSDVNAQNGVDLLDIFFFLGLWFDGPCRGG